MKNLNIKTIADFLAHYPSLPCIYKVLQAIKDIYICIIPYR